MNEVVALPYTVIEHPHLWISMSDGVRLSARIWRPQSSDRAPVPAILELIPYRKRDFTSYRDAVNLPYIAGYGYACVRVDVRGSGDSEGVLTDEYLDRELQDAEEILAWLVAQPWCSGKTGMWGMSWGGFIALQVAARQPPSLSAIITVSSTDDRYADDVHYMGGSLLLDNLSWAGSMSAYNSLPPDPETVGELWREIWHDRLKNSGVWLSTWLRHQRRDEYWKHGSVCENYGDIQVPVFAVSGWADGYSNSVFRLMANLQVPRRGLIGPWSHKYPHLATPGPAIGFLQEAVKWWDYFLKGISNDVMDGPMLQMWMQASIPPATSYSQRPGRWIGEANWPSPRITWTQHSLTRGRLAASREIVTEETLTTRSPLSVGQHSGKWCTYGAPPDFPGDQRSEDENSLVFDSDFLTEQFEIVGAPTAELDITVDEPVAMIAVRLCDVDNSGRSTRVTYGVLNLTHRDSHAHPAPLIPGRRYSVRVQMNDIAHSFSPGHRVRFAISTSYWPMTWPSPHPFNLEVHCGASSLFLPVCENREPGPLVHFQDPEGAPAVPPASVTEGQQFWKVSNGAIDIFIDSGIQRHGEIDLDLRRVTSERYSYVDNQINSVRGEAKTVNTFSRSGWNVQTETTTVLTSTATHFHIHAELRAYENDVEVASQVLSDNIPRDLL